MTTLLRMLCLLLVSALVAAAMAGDINRQSIVFNDKTPDVFYCPQVRGRPGNRDNEKT